MYALHGLPSAIVFYNFSVAIVILLPPTIMMSLSEYNSCYYFVQRILFHFACTFLPCLHDAQWYVFYRFDCYFGPFHFAFFFRCGYCWYESQGRACGKFLQLEMEKSKLFSIPLLKLPLNKRLFCCSDLRLIAAFIFFIYFPLLFLEFLGIPVLASFFYKTTYFKIEFTIAKIKIYCHKSKFCVFLHCFVSTWIPIQFSVKVILFLIGNRSDIFVGLFIGQHSIES